MTTITPFAYGDQPVRVFYYDDSKTGEAKGKTTLKITAKGLTDLAKLHAILPESVRDALHVEDAA